MDLPQQRRAVLVSTFGDKGVRDPAIIRSHDGKKFYLLATDLRIANRKGWGAARHQGSTSLIIWESIDLVNWSEPRMVVIASAIPEAGCAWAPEAIYDDSTGDYFVYWTTMSPRNGVTEGRIYYARTKDFRTFTPPVLYNRAQRPRRHHRHADHRGTGAEAPLLSRLARPPDHVRRC
jgi:hypothetical protein